MPSQRGTAWSAASAVATHIAMGSGRVPIEFRPTSTCRDRNPGSVGRITLAQARGGTGTGRNSRGTAWGLSRNRDRSGSSRMVTEWGLGLFTIEQTTEDEAAIHRLAASRLRRATATSPPTAGSGPERRSATRPASRSVTRAERAIRTASNPGTSRGGALGGDGGRMSARTASERDLSAGEVRGRPRGSPVPDGRRRVSAGDLRRPCERRGGR